MQGQGASIQIEELRFDWNQGQASVTYTLPGDQHANVLEIKTLLVDLEAPPMEGPLAEVIDVITAFIDAALIMRRNPPAIIPPRR